MLRHLRIENFKAWKDTGEMELAPISVFLGTNSSGKSSIIQFLMMLKQTVQDPDPAVVLNTGDDKTIVDVGLPSHMLHNRDISQRLTFSYDWDIAKQFLYSLDSSFSKSVLQSLLKTEAGYYLGTSARFSCSLSVGSFDAITVENLSYEGTHAPDFLFSVELKKMDSQGGTSYAMTSKNALDNSSGPDLSTPLKYYGFSEEMIQKHKSLGILRTFNQIHPQLFSSIFYLGPLRDRASRFYAWKGNPPSDVGIDGKNAVFAMLSARMDFRKYQLPHDKAEYEIDTAVAEMLKKMGLIEQFRVQKIGPSRAEYEVQVRTKGSPVWADLPDVGCGVSQVLPVLVELFYAPPGSILLMEQPELHLHPSAQAALADVMIDAVQATENGKPRNIQLIIETHSEYFLRRLQRRVAEEVIDENAVRGYFCDSSTDPFQMKRLELDAYGNILNWPRDFFGDMAGDIFQQAEAAFGRKKDEYEKNAESH